MVNPYQCPDSVYEAMQDLDCLVPQDSIPFYMPLLRAVIKLGPMRVHWLGPLLKKDQGNVGMGKNLSCWALDHKRAAHNELLIAAGLDQLVLTGPTDFPSEVK